MQVKAEIEYITGVTHEVIAENLGQLLNKIQPYRENEKVFVINIYEKKLIKSIDGLALRRAF